MSLTKLVARAEIHQALLAQFSLLALENWQSKPMQAEI
jgi:hypothetical protein